MVNVETLVGRMQSSGRRGMNQPGGGIDQVKRCTGDSKVHISDVTDENRSYESVQGEDNAQVREEVRKSVERLRLEVEMISSQQETAGGEVSAEALAKGFTCPEDFQIREERIEYGDGVYYEGEVLGKLRHGKGVYHDASGAEYSGDFRYDIVEGKAKAKMPDGSTYDGDWLAGNPHGMGKSTYPKGGVYEGDFERGSRSGWGKMVFVNGDWYEGEWKDDVIHGEGRWTNADGSYFQGAFDKGERVRGKFVSRDGSEEYTGEWRGQTRHGKGMLYIKTFGKYDGMFKDDVPHGEGTCVYVDGSVYEGEFQDGVRCGKGIFKLQSLLYQGEWKDDRMHGKGFLMAESGDKYVGEFQEGKKEGKGRMQYHNGTVYEGEWKGGVRHGRGTCKYDNGDVYVGDWVNDKRHGRGTCKFKDGTKFRGAWEDDAWVQTGADPQRTRIAGAGTVRAEVGNVAKFLIQARDSQGNKRLNGGDAFQVQLVLHGECGNPDIPEDEVISVTGHVKDNDDGTYEVTYSSEISGVYELSVLTEVSQEHVADSPYPVRLLPGAPCYKTCLVRGEGKSSAECGQETHFEILIRDMFGNCCSGHQWQDQIKLTLRLEGNLHDKHIDCIPTGDGRLLCTYLAPEEEGYYRLHVENDKGIAVPGTPFSVHVRNGNEQPVPHDDDGDQVVEIEKVHDTNRLWEQIAMESYMQDGNVAGWDSDDEEDKSQEDDYSKSHPDVPVVENLEDLWLVSKLQQERKSKEEERKQKKLQEMKSKLQETFGQGQEPSIEDAQNAMKELIADEMKQAVADLESMDRKTAAPGEKPRDLHVLAASLDDLA